MNISFKNFAIAVIGALVAVNSAIAQLPSNYQLDDDWLIASESFKAKVVRDGDQIHLENGLIRRSFFVKPNVATLNLENLMTGESMLRSVRPEASVTLNGRKFAVGGLQGQPNHAYLTHEWADQLKPIQGSLQFVGIETGKPKARLEWKRVRHCSPDADWPPPGVYLRMDYELPRLKKAQVDSADSGEMAVDHRPVQDVKVSIHYELYDGVPLISKWMTVENKSQELLVVDRFTAEILAVVEHENQVETRDGVDLKKPETIHVETDMAFGGFNHENANRHTVHWRPDPLYTSQVNYKRLQPCLLEIEPKFGPAQDVEPGETFESFRVFELVYDSYDRERRGLSLRKMYRTIAPWVTENPLMLHCKSSDEKVVRQAVDQAATTGFEMVILSFGSGFQSENDEPEYLRKWSAINEYAMSRGIHLGSYSLYSSRNAGKGNNIIPPKGLSNAHGQCPAITSSWGQTYIAKLYNLFDKTGFLVFENDGPYPGDVDVTERLPLQKGVNDSRWVHWRIWTDFYKHLRSKGVYMNCPDYYYLSGSNKCGMGYREVNWSLQRVQQRVHTRQNIYDGTWTKTPSMGWMFVPLVQYHGGGSAATIEPLKEHLDHYETMLRSNLGLGVQACYRGPRLYDSPETKAMVTDVVSWFKKYRDILESDVIHGRRADGKDLDWMLHVNPNIKNRGLLSVYNPTDQAITKTIKVPLYYTGLRGKAQVSENGKMVWWETLDDAHRLRLKVTVPANGYSFWLCKP